MTGTWKRWIVVSLALVVIAGLMIRRVALSGRLTRARASRAPFSSPQRGDARATLPAPGEVGAPVPAFRFPDISGREVTSEHLRGKVLLIDFWATWCAPCKVEMPGYQRLQERYGPRGLVVIGFALDTSVDDVSRFGRKLGVNYTLALSSPDVQKALGEILGIPTTILVDRNGVIRKRVVGFEYTEPFEAALKELL